MFYVRCSRFTHRFIVRPEISSKPKHHTLNLASFFVNPSKLRFGDVALILGDVKMALEFGSGSEGVVQKLNEFRVGARIEPLSDICHNGYRRFSSLVSKAIISGKLFIRGKLIHRLTKLSGALPCLDILKPSDPHVELATSDLEPRRINYGGVSNLELRTLEPIHMPVSMY